MIRETNKFSRQDYPMGTFIFRALARIAGYIKRVIDDEMQSMDNFYKQFA